MKMLFENWRKFLEEECDEDEVESLATFAHSGQFRRSGEPYIVHPRSVARLAIHFGYSEAIRDAAFLHDAIEDYKDPKEMSKLIDEVCPEALPIVKELTHDKSVAYTDYVLSFSPEAIAVKLLDMYHNSLDLKPGQRQFLKYHNALKSLGGKPDGITDQHWKALTTKLGVST